LYTLAAPGENYNSYDVTDAVAGATRFYVRADIGGGMFLYSDSNDRSVLEVKYTYGKPLEKINALFAGVAPAPASGDLAGDPTENACRAIAVQLIQLTTLPEALLEMRRSTEPLSYRLDYNMPARFSEIASILKEPLSPNLGVTRPETSRLASWWSTLGADERREFLTAYGVWCARARYLR